MRIFFHTGIIFIVISLFSGCARTNAFTRFDFSKVKERATSSLRTSKINRGDQIYGVFSSVYLNEVIPEKYNGMEYFYITIYTKDGAKLFDPNLLDKRKMTLRLNGKLPVKIKKLESGGKFEGLIPLNNNWNSYYLVAFDEDDSEKLSLTLQSGYFYSQPLIYRKGEQ
ncbi:hypothetical protein [Sulfurimonas sp. HSL-1716]|uniref:hypothetical protein n=1 Tax=Hydrocurvibacter sulfurireducens TaxID=3131937 RepID=UPI0031F9122C